MPRVHGGDLHRIKRLYPDVQNEWIDLSTGINPWVYPWLEKIPKNILSEASTRLPGKSDYAACKEKYAAYLGCGKKNIFISAGSQTLIEEIPKLFSHTDTFILGPTYHEHERCWDRMGHNIHYLPYSAESLSIIPTGKVIIITTPNNPDGQIINRDILYRFACDYCERGGSVIIDEAFMDLSPENSLCGLDLPTQTFVLRSIGKFFGLAGIRVGALITSEAFCKRMMGLTVIWNVPTLSLTIAEYALSDKNWIAENRKKLSQAMEKLTELITSSDYQIIGKTDLFCLMTGNDIPDLNIRLANEGIYVRSFANNPDQLRIGLPTDDEAFLRLSKVLQDHKSQ